MATLKRGDTELYYEVHGPASARCTLVLLHGVGGNHASWFYQVAAWRAQFRIVVPDARGFGNSTDAEGAGRDQFLADLEAILEAEEVDRCVLVGQSMGGGTAIDFACAHPGRVAAMVLADTLFGIRLPGEIAGEMSALTQRNAALSQQERVLGPTFRGKSPGLSALYTALASFNRANVRTLKGTQVEHGLDEMAALPMPVLFVVGQEDVLFPPAMVKAVQSALPQSRFMELAKVGHSAYFEAPEAFNRVVEYWVEGVIAAKSSD